MRRKILIGIAIVAAIPLLAAAIALLYLNFADLGGWRSTVEELVTDALGRELRIAGEFKPDIGFTTRLVASEVTLANPEGWPESHMVSVDRLEAELDLLSVLFGPLTIHEVLMDGATVLLAKDGDGRATWQFETGAADVLESNEGSEPFELVFDHVSITGLDLVFSDYSLPQSISFVDAALDLRSDDAGIIDLNLTGELNDAKLDLKGRLGTLRNVLAAGPLEHDLRGQLGDVEIGLKGRIGDLASLEGIDIVAEVAGSDLATVGSRFGVSGLPVGPFRLDVAASPSPAGSSVVVACNLGEITARFDGKVDSLPAFKDLELDIEASGPSVAEVGAMSGLDGLPNSPFKVAGHVHWQGFPVAFDSFQATVGDNRLALEGVLGAPPDMLDTDFAIEASGPNIGALAALAGLQLPEKAFQVNGRLVRTDAGINVENVAARIGATTFNADGVVGVPPEFTGTTLTLSAKGPDMSAYAGLLGIDLPAESFAVAGRLIPEGNYITLEGVKARLGRNKGTIAGKIKAAVGFVGSDIRLNAEGPGLAWLEPITGLSDLPAQPYRVDGRLRVRSAGLQLDDVKVGLGDLSLRVGGFVASSPGFEGTKVSLQAHGPDISIPASLAGLSTLPRDSFRVSGTFSVTPNGYGLEGIDAALGDISAKANGIVGVGPELYGTRLNFEANGSRLSALDWIDDRVQLPGAPFSASGRIGIGPDGYRLEQVTAELAGHRVEADGTVVPKPDLIGSNMSVSIAGPDLGHAGRMVAETDLVELPALPEKPYTLTGNLRISDTGYELQTIDMTLGAAMGRLDGMIGRPPELLGTDITIDGDGPNASLFTALTGVSVPVTPFRFNGRIQRQDAGFRFEDLSVQLGEYHATIDGTLGEPPKLAGTDVLLHAEGPSLLLFEQLFDLPSLPHQPFRVDGRFNGDPRHFSGERIAVQIGESDVAGEFRLDLTGTPRLRAELESRRLDVAGYLARRAAQKREIAENEETQPAERRDRVIPDTPLELEVIRDANADVVWTVAELQMPIDRFHDITIDLALDDGRLQLGPMAATGSSGGVLNADLLLEPAGAAYKLTTNLTVEGGYLNLSGQRGNLSQRPEVDIYLQYSGAGASAHELATSSDGFIAVVVGEGVVDNSLINLVAADILVTLLETFNPFAESEKSSHLECAVILSTFADGYANLEEMAMQSDRMTLLGSGSVNLDSEEIKLNWITKPRKGFGLSASMITNPYISLGGTLANPRLDLKPLEAMTTTGIAVATGGLSILAKGLYDRVTSERKVCKQAKQDGRKALEERGFTVQHRR